MSLQFEYAIQGDLEQWRERTVKAYLTALKEALRAASEVVRNQLFFNRHEDGWIEVEDEDHREIMRLPLRAAAY